MEVEAYKVHYKNWNKRFDEIKSIKHIREPMLLIQDPLMDSENEQIEMRRTYSKPKKAKTDKEDKIPKNNNHRKCKKCMVLMINRY